MRILHQTAKPARTRRMSIGFVLALLLALSADLAPGPALAQSELKRGGTLVSAIPDNPPDLMNGVGTNILTGAIGGQIFDTLVRGDRNMKILPSLAKAWDISPDGLSVTFHLQAGVKWHDGRPFTSEDVRYSFLEINRKYNSIASGAFAAITRIDTPDELTVVIHIASPDPAFFPWSFAQPNGQVFPKHIYEGSDPRRNPMNFKPIGTGPFVFKEWARGSHITLERNPDYFRADEVLLDRLIFQVIPDAGARQIALERGDVDHLPYFSITPSAIGPLSRHKFVQVIAHSITSPALASTVFGTVCHPCSKPRREFVEPRGHNVQDRGFNRPIQPA